jgi:hypothetical protein
MARRFLCLGAFLLLILLSAPACSSDRNKNKGPAVHDPDGNYVPKPSGGKAG